MTSTTNNNSHPSRQLDDDEIATALDTAHADAERMSSTPDLANFRLWEGVTADERDDEQDSWPQEIMRGLEKILFGIVIVALLIFILSLLA